VSPADENIALVRRLIAEVQHGWNPATLEKFYAPVFRRYLNVTEPPLTREETWKRAGRLRAAFPDGTSTIEDIFAAGDRVAYRLTIRGTHTGEFLGVPPSGARIAVSFLAIVRIEDGRLVEEWGGLDQPSLLRQIGASVIRGAE
jgi:predicted ester cyclase